MPSYLDTILADNPAHFWRPAIYPYGASLIDDFGSSPSVSIVTSGTAWEGFSGVASDSFSMGEQLANSSSPGVCKSEDAYAVVSPFSMEAWIWLYNASVGATRCALAWDGIAANTPSLLLDSTGHAQFNSNNVSATDSALCPIHSWVHLVGTQDSTNNRLYVNGSLKATASASGLSLSTKFVYLAGAGAGLVGMKGWVAELALYDYALNSTQIAAHIAAADYRTIKPTPLAAPANASIEPIAGLISDLSEILAAVRHTYSSS